MARILVVDDEEVVRSFIRTVLQRHGHEVIEAVDGNQALELFERDPADLVMVDLVMPNKHGLDTILELREKHPRTRFIVMTGVLPGLLETETIAALVGVLKTLTKPMPPTVLIQAVHDVLAEEQVDAR